MSYRSYWCRVVLAELRAQAAFLRTSRRTGFREADVAPRTSLNLLKYWKGSTS